MEPTNPIPHESQIRSVEFEEFLPTGPSVSLRHKKPIDFIVTGEQLLNMKQNELQYLVKDLLPKTGVVALVGSSDTGKSTLLRQLAISIAYNDSDFVGFPIQAKHNKVIYVSTEDDTYAMAYLISRQRSKDRPAEDLQGLYFIFDTAELITKLDSVLKLDPVDCVIIDTFTDLYKGDMIITNKIRSYINDFADLSKKFDCLLIFLHHTGKRTDSLAPSKDNILGSQGFEAKMRVVMELRRDYRNSQVRHLCIVKGNYVREEGKSKSYALQFTDDMNFINTGERIPLNLLVKPDQKDSLKNDAQAIAMELKKKKMTVSRITEELQKQGFQFSRSTVGNWLKDAQSIQNSTELDGMDADGPETE